MVLGDDVGKTNFTILAGTPDQIDVALDPLLILNTPEEMTLKLFDIYGNSVDTSGWNMSIESSENTLISSLSNEPSKLVQ